jgi:cellulose synthase/poly-beta-1,6-N-acetylglucosamine synthase-like glycosyltransferase
MTPEADGAPTPLTWRLASLALLCGGFLLGERTAKSGVRPRSIALAAAAAGAYVGPVALASRRPPIPPADPTRETARVGPTFTVLVAARDEAAVLPNLIADVARQTHRDAAGEPCFELLVVDDRSTDGTAATVAEAAAAEGIAEITRLIKREGTDLPDGKGAALTAAQPAACKGEVIVVLDADARIGPTFLATLAHYIRAGASAVTVRRRVFGAGGSHLAGAQADEQTLDGELQRGRWAMGGCSEFRGNGIVVWRDLLAAVGGWRSEALTEDLDLSSRIAAERGVRVAWAIDAEVWEEPVGQWAALLRQRFRWAEGGLRRALEHGPAVLSSSRLSSAAKVDFALYVGQLVVAPFLLGLSAGSLRRGRPGGALAMIAIYGLVGGILAFDALRWEDVAPRRLPLNERIWRAARVSLFNGLWLAAIPAALWRLATRRGPVGYDKMAHGIGSSRPEGG